MLQLTPSAAIIKPLIATSMQGYPPGDAVEPNLPNNAGRARAFSVHIFTALGAGVALIAMVEAVREQWSAMFLWLGVALVIDGVDGTLARRYDVANVLPNWSGEALDLVIDYVTYVFIPAYAIVAGDLMPPWLAMPLGAAIVMSAALYFADRRMKTDDHHFRGFPALWNVAAFYLFLLQPQHWGAAALVALLVILTFMPIRVIHPMRVRRWRMLTLLLMVVWAVLALFAVLRNFDVSAVVVAALTAIGLYVLAADGLHRLAYKMKIKMKME
jgi:phosphatidylcholine synthase